MSTPTLHSATVPTWTLQDRLVKARQVAGYTQVELAARLGVGDKTIKRYEAGFHAKTAILIAWAAVCGVDYDWLVTGRVTIGYPLVPAQMFGLAA